MVDVFDEVEEELRREKLNAVYRKWAPWVIGGAVAIVVGVAGQQFWSYQTRTAAETASDAYIEASRLYEEGNLEEARSAFTEMAETGASGYAALSYMRLGEIAISQNDAQAAARYFEQAAARSPEPLTRQLAQYKAALALFDTLSYDDLSVRLTPLTEGEALFGTLARELIAAAAIRDERWEDARSQYRLLQVSLDAPPGVARRASEGLAYIRQNAPQDAAEAPVETAETAAPEGVDQDADPSADAESADTEGDTPEADGEAPTNDSEEGGQ